MPFFPTVFEPAVQRQVTDVFGGYNHNLKIGENEFYDMKNMTGDYYPLLSPRRRRGLNVVSASAKAILGRNWLDMDNVLHYYDPNGNLKQVDAGVFGPATERYLLGFGSYIIVMPDNWYFNTADSTDFGHINLIVASGGMSAHPSFTLCDVNGDPYTINNVGETPPANPTNNQHWIDTSVSPHVLKVWITNSSMWTTIPTTYIKISGIYTSGLKQYDSVNITGVTAVDGLNGQQTLWQVGDDYVVITGILDQQTSQSGGLSITREMPLMDFVIESGNRLWGCRYGPDRHGNMVNEIYASKLGDFTNWNSFIGISTDSYVASCGTDGPFTGAISHKGYPIFFKENCMHKVFGTQPSNFQIQAIQCRGVEKGSGKSVDIVNEVVYYKGINGVCAYDGSIPVEISKALGDVRLYDAIAGHLGNKYYITMIGSDGQRNMYVYDTDRGMWHKEDVVRASMFSTYNDQLHYIDIDDNRIHTIYRNLDGTEDPVEWMAESGVIGLSSADNKYISRMHIRASIDVGSNMEGFIQYDSVGGWEKVFSIKGKSLRSYNIPIKPRRCDHFRIRIVGEGDAKIYSITKNIEQGSDENVQPTIASYYGNRA